MAELVMRIGETALVRQLARDVVTCCRPGCTRSGPGPTHRYWWAEDPGEGQPDWVTNAYCSQECWAADQYGPAQAKRLRKWAERFTPGQFDWEGRPRDPVRA